MIERKKATTLKIFTVLYCGNCITFLICMTDYKKVSKFLGHCDRWKATQPIGTCTCHVPEFKEIKVQIELYRIFYLIISYRLKIYFYYSFSFSTKHFQENRVFTDRTLL